MIKLLQRVTPLLLAMFVSGCAFFSPQPDTSVSKLNVLPPSLMIATKSNLTAYVVVDNELLPDQMSLLNEGADTGFKLNDVHVFATRDLVRVFSNYFNVVKFATADAVPEDAAVVFIPKIDKFESFQTTVKMTWGLGVRLRGDADYIFSFAGESAGYGGSMKMDVVCNSMLENAVADFLSSYTDKKIHSKILEREKELGVRRTPRKQPPPEKKTPSGGRARAGDALIGPERRRSA